MTCCDGECASWERCYEGNECADESACGGADSPYLCCEREGSQTCQTEVFCASFRPCDDQNPCSGGTMCCNNPQVANEPICLGPDLCTFGLPCDAQAECGALFCCAIPGAEGPICVGECQEDWRR